jgi:hypothetical protein
MPLFPKIASPCPYLDRLDTAMDGDFCRMCERTVHDLTGMNRAERAAFVAECGGEACVSYTTRLSPAVAAAALAASTAILVSAAPVPDQRHKPRHAHVRPARVVRQPQPVYQLVGMIPLIPRSEPAKPAEIKPPEQPAVGPQPQTKRD